MANLSGEEAELSQNKHYVSSSNFSQFIYHERATKMLTSHIFFPEAAQQIWRADMQTGMPVASSASFAW